MKIGYDAKRAFLNNTGLGNYSRTLIENFSTFAQFKKQLFLYTPKQTNKFSLANTIIKTPQNWVPGSLWRSVLLEGQLQKDGLDLYHGLSHEIPFVRGRSPIKKIVTMHDLIYLRYPDQFSLVDRQIYDLKFRYAAAKADHIIAISEQTKTDLMHFFKTPEKKITVLYQACDESFGEMINSEDLSKCLEKYNLPGKFILSVGSLVERKNALRLIQAYAILDEQIPLVFVGDGGSYKQLVLNQIKELGLEERIYLLDRVDDKRDLMALYQMAEVFCYPSIFEGFGIPIIEALHSGTAVLTSLGSCFAEAGGNGALYADPLDVNDIARKIKKLLNDEGLRKRLVSQGRHHIEKFKGANLAQQLERIYLDLF